MRILIAGCGYLGGALAWCWTSSGHEVWGLKRRPFSIPDLDPALFHPIQGDLTRPDSLRNLPGADVVVFCQALAKKGDHYSETYVDATRHLLNHPIHAGFKMILFVSSTSVYGLESGAWVDETHDPGEGGYPDKGTRLKAQKLLEAENLILNSNPKGIVLRLGGIYGPYRNRIRAVLSGKAAPWLSKTYVNRIHVTDIVAAVNCLIEKGIPGEIYNGVDDEPSTHEAFNRWLYQKLSLEIPSGAGTPPSRLSNKRCSNQKLKALGFKPCYPSYREGYSELIRSEVS